MLDRVISPSRAITTALIFVSMVGCTASEPPGEDTISSAAAPRMAEIDAIIAPEVERDRFAGVVMIRREEQVIHQAAYGFASRELNVPHTIDGVFLTGSITKLMIASTVLKLVEAGELRLGQPVVEVFADSELNKVTEITIDHLLSHRSGLPGITSDVLERKTFEIEAGGNYQSEDFLSYVFAQPREGYPGERRVYGNLSYDVLEVIAEKVTGQEFSEVLSNLVLKPLKMHDSGVNRRELVIESRVPGYEPSKVGVENAYQPDGGSVYSTATDLISLTAGIFETDYLNKTDVKHLQSFGLVRDEIEIQGRSSIEVLWFNGIDTGYSAELAYYPESRTAVVLMSNIGSSQFADLRRTIAEVLHR